MKKRSSIMILLSLMTLLFHNSQAQQAVSYTHFEPPLTVLGQLNSDTLTLDINQDGIRDFGICWLDYPWTPYFIPLSPDFDFMIHQNGDATPLSSLNHHWLHENQYISYCDEYEWGIRLKCGNNFYYGWAFSDSFSEPNPGMPHNNIYIAFREIAFCTIPNYPLKWGQTSLNTEVDENDTPVFATIFPNPTQRIITVRGNNLRQAEVFNTVGQLVLSTKEADNELHIDMYGKPIGVYFVSITDAEGRKCVKKVVKE